MNILSFFVSEDKKVKWGNSISLILGLLLLLFGFVSNNRASRLNQDIATLQLSLDDLQNRSSVVVDSLYREAVSYRFQAIRYEHLISLKDSTLNDLSRRLSKVKADLADLKSSQTIDIITSDSVIIAVHDTIYQDATNTYAASSNFSFDDGYLLFNGVATFNLNDSVGIFSTANFDYSLMNSISIDQYTQRKNFLSPVVTMVTVTNNNPNTTLDKFRIIEVKPEKRFYDKWWFHQGVGLIGGYLLSKSL